MPLSEMGSAPALLGVAAQAAETGQRTKIAQDEQTQKALESSNSSMQANAPQMITITDQLAKGAKNATGDDSWDRAVGTKMDARIYSTMLTLGSKSRYHQDLLEDRDKLEGMREKSRENLYKEGQEGKEAFEELRQKHKKELEDIEDKHRKELEAMRLKNKKEGSGKEDPKDKEFLKTYRAYATDLKGFNGTLLAQMAKQDPQRAKELQDKALFMQKNKDRFDKLQGVSEDGDAQGKADKNGKAVDWLKKNYPKLTNPTDHDIEWALGQMPKNT